MMDPISIITLTASTSAATYQVSRFIYMFINSAQNVDSSVEALGSEVTGLRRVLDALSNVFDEGMFKTDKVTAFENAPIWAAVAGSLNDCRITLEAMAQKMARATSNATSQNIFKQSLRLIKLKSWMDDIQALRLNINAHSNNLQVSLQMVSILALGQSPDAAIEELGHKIDRLSDSLSSVQLREAPNRRSGIEKSTSDKNSTSVNVIQLQRAARQLLANPDDVLSYGRLNSASKQEQETSTALFDDVISDFTRSLYDFASGTEDADLEKKDHLTFSDSDDDTETEIAEMSFKKGNEKYQQGQYATAETYYRDGLRHVDDVRWNSKNYNLETIRIRLIQSNLMQEKWQESELMLMMLIKSDSRTKITANTLQAHHLLAMAFLCQYEFNSAVYHCQQAVDGRKRMFGKTHLLYFQSLSLLALIHEANGDLISASVYMRKVPTGERMKIGNILSQFMNYSIDEHLRMSLKEKFAAIQQLSESDLIQRPNRSQHSYDTNSKPPPTFKLGSDSLNFGKALIWAADEDRELVTRWLLARGADVESSVSGDSALIVAASKGREGVVQTLLLSGADVNYSGRSERTALHWAALWGHESTVQILLEYGANQNKLEKDGSAPLHDAAVKGHASIVKLLLFHGADIDARTKRGHTALLLAADNQHIEVAKVLIAEGADSNAMSVDGSTPLLRSASSGNDVLIKLLVKAGANLTATNMDGSTPLLLAGSGCKISTLQFMLEKGAKPDSMNKSGETPLLRAVESGAEMVVRLLLEHGADPSKKLHDRNAMQIAKLRNIEECVKVLQEFGAPE